MKRLHRLTILSVASCLLGIATILPVWAAEPPQPPPASNTTKDAAMPDAQLSAATVASNAAVQITLIQASGASPSDEFIELTNATSEPVAIGGWQLRYRNAASAAPGSTVVATIAAKEDDDQTEVILQEHEKYILHTASITPPAGVRSQQYTARLSDADKTIGLFVPDMQTCTAAVSHARAVGVAALQQLPPVTLPGCELPSVQPATQPATAEPQPTDEHPVTEHEEASESVSPSEDQSATAEPVIPARNNGLYAPQISELLPNPAKPGLDASDEYIELYNTNNAVFELSGFMLEAGAKTKKRYTFPAGTLLQPKSFTAFFSRDTKLTLPNTSGQVWLLDPLGRQLASSEPYQGAKDGQAWLSANGTWQWTVKPTAGALNALQAPAATAAKGAASKAPAARTSSTTASGSVAAASTTAVPSQSAGKQEPPEEQGGFNPLHPVVLALTGVIAVSYGIYEYRRDLANKFHQFRANRAARAAARQASSGR